MSIFPWGKGALPSAGSKRRGEVLYGSFQFLSALLGSLEE